MIDACGTHSNVVNVRIDELDLTKFLHSLDKSLAWNAVKSKLQSVAENASVPNEGVIFGNRQVALLWQRDRATRLLVEILQLQNIPIVWHYLRDPTFSRFTQYQSVTDTHTETDGQIHDDGMYCVSIAPRSKIDHIARVPQSIITMQATSVG